MMYIQPSGKTTICASGLEECVCLWSKRAIKTLASIDTEIVNHNLSHRSIKRDVCAVSTLHELALLQVQPGLSYSSH